MSGIQLKVLPEFPARLLGIAPIVVTKNGLTYTISVEPTVDPNLLNVSQVKMQLIADDPQGLVRSNIPADVPYDLVNIAWNASQANLGGTLFNFIQTTLGFTASQMQAFWTAAMGQPVSP